MSDSRGWSLSGYVPELPTPFDDNGNPDLDSLARLCRRHLEWGAAGLVVCDTAGEAATLTRAEHKTIIRAIVDIAKRKVPVIAATASNSTSQAVQLAKDAEAAGADAVLCIVPYYNKPMQAGLTGHFRTIADAIRLPIVLQDIPSRTVTRLDDETVIQLAQYPQFIGLKDGTGDITRIGRLRARLTRDFKLMCGNDAVAFAFAFMGADGCISAAANVAPDLYRQMMAACRTGDIEPARRAALPLAQLNAVLSREGNPAHLKYALSLLYGMSPKVRLPLVELDDEAKAEVASALDEIRAAHVS